MRKLLLILSVFVLSACVNAKPTRFDNAPQLTNMQEIVIHQNCVDTIQIYKNTKVIIRVDVKQEQKAKDELSWKDIVLILICIIGFIALAIIISF